MVISYKDCQEFCNEWRLKSDVNPIEIYHGRISIFQKQETEEVHGIVSIAKLTQEDRTQSNFGLIRFLANIGIIDRNKVAHIWQYDKVISISDGELNSYKQMLKNAAIKNNQHLEDGVLTIFDDIDQKVKERYGHFSLN